MARAEPPLAPLEEACETLASEAAYFRAPDPGVASEQADLLKRAIAAARSPEKPAFLIECERAAGEDCPARQVLASLSPADIMSVDLVACVGERPRSACAQLRVGKWVIGIDSQYGAPSGIDRVIVHRPRS
jgi:hypothetical protein